MPDSSGNSPEGAAAPPPVDSIIGTPNGGNSYLPATEVAKAVDQNDGTAPEGMATEAAHVPASADPEVVAQISDAEPNLEDRRPDTQVVESPVSVAPITEAEAPAVTPAEDAAVAPNASALTPQMGNVEPSPGFGINPTAGGEQQPDAETPVEEATDQVDHALPSGDELIPQPEHDAQQEAFDEKLDSVLTALGEIREQLAALQARMPLGNQTETVSDDEASSSKSAQSDIITDDQVPNDPPNEPAVEAEPAAGPPIDTVPGFDTDEAPHTRVGEVPGDDVAASEPQEESDLIETPADLKPDLPGQEVPTPQVPITAAPESASPASIIRRGEAVQQVGNETAGLRAPVAPTVESAEQATPEQAAPATDATEGTGAAE